MDISQLNDEKELKSLAYDQMVITEQSQNNLRLINQRLAELQDMKNKKNQYKKEK